MGGKETEGYTEAADLFFQVGVLIQGFRMFKKES